MCVRACVRACARAGMQACEFIIKLNKYEYYIALVNLSNYG